MPSNLVQYGGYLAILAFPISLGAAFAPISARRLLTRLVVLLCAFLIGCFLLPSNGEMTFGPFDRWIGPAVARGILASCFVLFALGLLRELDGTTFSRRNAVAAAILLYVLCLSSGRPSQRYLLLILPFYYVHLLNQVDYGRLALPVLTAFVALNSMIVINQVGTGRISSALAQAIIERGLVGQVDLGSYVSHLDIKSAKPDEAKYLAMEGCADNALLCLTSDFVWRRQVSLVTVERK